MSNIITLVGAGRTFLSTNDLFIQANTNDSGQVEIVLPNTKSIFGNTNTNTPYNYIGVRFVDIGNNASVNNIVVYAFDDDLINGQQTLTINTNGGGGLINLIGEGEWIFDENNSSTGGSSIIEEGSGLNSSERINSGNTSSGAYSTALGLTNQSKGCASSVLGGGCNTAGGNYSSVLNGTANSTNSVNGQIFKFLSQYSGILPDGEYLNVPPSSQTGIGTGALFNFGIRSNKIKIQVTNGGENYQLQDILTFNGTIFGGTSPSDDILITITEILDATSDYSTILNGRNNNTSACLSSVMNGKCNSASAIYSSVSNGYQNSASAIYSSVSNGYQNSAEGQYSSVSNGYSNSATAIYSSVSNGYRNTADGQYSCCGCIYGGYSSVSNGYQNRAGGQFSSVINGRQNSANNRFSSVSNGYNNNASGGYSSVSNGCENSASGYSSSVNNGLQNNASGNFSTITNGRCNTASGYASFIAGGLNNNTCSQCKSFIVGSDISADRECATFVNNLSIKDIPTSSAGLPSGAVWRNGTILEIVV